MEVHSIGAPAFVPGVVATINLFGKRCNATLGRSLFLQYPSWLWLDTYLHASHCGNEKPKVVHQITFLVSNFPRRMLRLFWDRRLHVSYFEVLLDDTEMLKTTKLLWKVCCQPITGERRRNVGEDSLRHFHSRLHHDYHAVGPSGRQVCESCLPLQRQS